MQMSYDLKMYSEDTKDGNITRMNDNQRKDFLGYYNGLKDSLELHKFEGDQLTEWKFQRYMRDYLATATSLDRNIGRLLDYIESEGLKDNTIVIYLSDQGFI